jgi:hypothetical protein
MYISLSVDSIRLSNLKRIRKKKEYKDIKKNRLKEKQISKNANLFYNSDLQWY